MRRAALVAVFCLASCAPTNGAKRNLVAGPIQPSSKNSKEEAPRPTIQLDTKDVLGAPVRLGNNQERVAVVVLISRTSKDESSELLKGFDERLLNAPIETVSIVDMRKYSGIMHSLAERQLRKSAEESRTKRRQRREAQHADASDAVVNRWHLLGDYDGKLFEKFGAGAEPQHPVGFVVDMTGGLHGPYGELSTLVAAANHAMAANGRAAKESHSRMRANSGERTRM
jgi:hypothetical protein